MSYFKNGSIRYLFTSHFIFLEIARLLFDIFYDEYCVSEKTFLYWLENPNKETNAHEKIKKSTQEFFKWLSIIEIIESSSKSEEEDDNDN